MLYSHVRGLVSRPAAAQNNFRKVLKFWTAVSIVDSEQSNFMKIEPSQLTAAPRPFKNAHALQRLPAGDASHWSRSRSFEPELAATPDVRSEVVARGKALIADPNYPSQAQLKAVAAVLAGCWAGSGSRSSHSRGLPQAPCPAAE